MNTMKRNKFFVLLISASFLYVFTSIAAADGSRNLVAYAGGSGHDAFRHVHVLSNGDLLVAGSTDSLDWIPNQVKRVELSAESIQSSDPDQIGFLMLLSPDAGTIRQILHFPQNTVADISRIRSTEVPGQPTGSIYISGRRTLSPGMDPKDDGYFIARLNGNFVDRPVTGVEWVINVKAPPRKASGYKGSSSYKDIQPWDVGSDGRVIYGTGSEYDFDWAAIEAVDASGQPMKMPDWPAQEGGKSFIALKAGRKGSLRSQTQEDFDFRTNDENANPGRKGKFPDDYYFSGPNAKGPGYTGYRISDKPTQRLGQIAIDRRNNYLYFGYSTQTRLPNGNPDFEPAIVSMTDTGKLLWWARGYQEIERPADNPKKDQDSINSPPDQYVEAVAIDYTNDRLVALLRCHGNGVINFWQGDQLKANPSGKSFQRKFTGKNGNIHISWIGKFGLTDGIIYNATYMAELTDNAKVQGKLQGLLEGWPDPNAGWPDVNTTRAVEELSVLPDGSPLVIAMGRRVFTTTNAHMQMVKPGEGQSAWSMFVRTYAPDLSTITYSTILRAPWDPVTGKSTGGQIKIFHAQWAGDKIVVVGQHETPETGLGEEMKTQNIPGWAKSLPEGPTTAVLAVFKP